MTVCTLVSNWSRTDQTSKAAGMCRPTFSHMTGLGWGRGHMPVGLLARFYVAGSPESESHRPSE